MFSRGRGILLFMTARGLRGEALCCLRLGLIGLMGTTAWAVQPTSAATAVFDSYVAAVESRLARQHETADRFVGLAVKGSDGDLRLRRGDFLVEKLVPGEKADLAGAMLHDWRGTAFVQHGKAAEFEELLKDFGNYTRLFAPQVLAAKRTGGQGDNVQAMMRFQQHHVLTVTLDSNYDVQFGRLDAVHEFSISRSTRITEVDRAGTRDERALSSREEHGFLWRMNTYWSWEERDGGLYVQIESISLTRAIPSGLGWAIRPFVENVPRESLEFTLRSACAAVRKP